MDKEELLFNKIASGLSKGHHVSKGKMMSAPGIKYKTKFFAFYYNREMIFKLGSSFDPKKHDVKNCRSFNPFMNKAPMKNWFQLPYSEHTRWKELATYALNFLKAELRNSR